MTEKKTYSDEEIKEYINQAWLRLPRAATMLQQLMEQRDVARKARDVIIREIQREQVREELKWEIESIVQKAEKYGDIGKTD